MTFNKSMFSSYTTDHASSVELGSSNTVKIVATGTVMIPISVNGKRV